MRVGQMLKDQIKSMDMNPHAHETIIHSKDVSRAYE